MTTINIFTHRNQPMYHEFTIVEETEKAYKLQSYYNGGKFMWLPKSSLSKMEGYVNTYLIHDWFRRKLEKWQLSFLQN